MYVCMYDVLTCSIMNLHCRTSDRTSAAMTLRTGGRGTVRVERPRGEILRHAQQMLRQPASMGDEVWLVYRATM